jgi:NAD(P)H-dependent FMN reductase
MARLLIVHHSPTPTVRALTDALASGARHDEIEGVEVVVRTALDAASASGAEDVLAADGYVLATPANFGYMSGALKHFFDTIFLHAGGALTDDGGAAAAPPGRKPYGLLVHGRYDTTGAVRSVQSIVSALGWTQAAEVVALLGDVGPDEESAAHELGATIAALIGD